MTENSTYKYLPGICYTCQKCLHCFKHPQDSPCRCQKLKITRVKNPQQGQQIYQRAYTPNQTLPKLNQFLLSSNTKFGYNSDFNKYFSYSSCSACNSKLQRLKERDKKAQIIKKTKVQKSKKDNQINDNEVIFLDVNNNKGDDDEVKKNKDSNDKIEDKSNNNKVEDDDNVHVRISNKECLVIDETEDDDVVDDVNEDYVDDDDIDEDDVDEEEDDDIVDEIKIQIVVKNKDTKSPTAKILTIKPVNYTSVMEKIHYVIQKSLGDKITSRNDYSISYKAINARGPSNTLEDRSDFHEFITEYRKVILTGKKMSVIVIVNDNITKKRSKKNKKVSFIMYCI